MSIEGSANPAEPADSTVSDDPVSPVVAAAPPAEPGPLTRLLELQALDLAADRIEYRRRHLPEREAVVSLEIRIGDLERRSVEVTARRDELAQRQAELDEQVNHIRDRVALIEERLRSGRAGSYRDEQAMSAEASSLDGQRRVVEDREIEVMEALEPVEGELEAIEGELAVLRGEFSAGREALTQTEAGLDHERHDVEAQRAPVLAEIPPALDASYEKLRAKLGGIGAAKLIDGACSGCHLKLASGERDRLLHSAPGTVVYCEQCGRILVP
jgi:hypothetical protein